MKLQKIESTSAVLRNVCRALFVPVLILPIVASVGVLTGRATNFNFNGQFFPVDGLGLGSRLILVGVVLLTAAVIFKALCHLRGLFDNYSRREIFTTGSARQIRQFGIACILWGLVKAAWAFLPLVVSSTSPSTFALTTDSVFIGFAIVGISWFAEMAAALREENDLTI